MINRLTRFALSFLVFLPFAVATASADDGKLKKEELDQLLAPIALYPDDLLTNVLMASTYPLDVVHAARWRKEPANAKLKGDDLAKVLETKDWDPSVKALVQFPDVLSMMSDKLDWTQKLGDAFLAQQDEVMDEIQYLRAKADEAGNLKSNKQQKVVKEAASGSSTVYIIEPATADIVYVPTYDPTIVYGPWWYPAYPPYYWSYPGAAFVNGFFWAAGVAVAAEIWDWNRFDWRHHDIDIDVNKWNKININRGDISVNKWEHRPDHRGPVPYRSKEVREKYKKGDQRPAAGKEHRGYDKGDIDRSKVEARLKDTDHGAIKDRAREPAGERVKDRPADRPGKVKENAGDRSKAGDRSQAAARDLDRAKAARPSPGAFDVKRGPDVRRDAARGHASREVARSHRGGGAVARGGGGGGRAARGGGGGRRR